MYIDLLQKKALARRSHSRIDFKQALVVRVVERAHTHTPLDDFPRILHQSRTFDRYATTKQTHRTNRYQYALLQSTATNLSIILLLPLLSTIKENVLSHKHKILSYPGERAAVPPTSEIT